MRSVTSSLLFAVILLGAMSAKASGEILYDASGSVRYNDQSIASGYNPYMPDYKEAPDVCEAVGKGHLPTIRELAQFAQGRGAAGILELSAINPSNVPSGYYKVAATNYNGTSDAFYYSNAGYQPMSVPGELDDAWVWSSSYLPADALFGQSLNAKSGEIEAGDFTDPSANLCLANR